MDDTGRVWVDIERDTASLHIDPMPDGAFRFSICGEPQGRPIAYVTIDAKRVEHVRHLIGAGNTLRGQLDGIEEALLRLWAAALDAQTMLRDEGATEADYMRKQRFHIEAAKTEIARCIAALLPPSGGSDTP